MAKIAKPERNSETEDLRRLFTKHKKLLGKELIFEPFEEPIMLFERENGTVEFKEKATTGRYNFTHSNGEERYIIIKGRPKNFVFGHKTVRGYYCHENYPFPLPEEPILTTEEFNLIIEKTLHDKKEWETKLTKERNKTIMTVAYAIAIIIGCVILYKLLIPAPVAQPVQAQLTEAIKNNATLIINKTAINVM